VTSSWFSLSTLNYDARSTTHQILNLCSSFCARNQVYSSVHFNPYIHRQHIGDKVSGLDGSKYSLRHHATIIYIYKKDRKKERKKERKTTTTAFWIKVKKGTSVLRNEALNVLVASFTSCLDERRYSALAVKRSRLQSQLHLECRLRCSLPNTWRHHEHYSMLAQSQDSHSYKNNYFHFGLFISHVWSCVNTAYYEIINQLFVTFIVILYKYVIP